MKQKVAITLSLLILFASLRDLTTYVNYFVNLDYIIDQLCINREKPEVMCYGTCYLIDNIVEDQNPVKDIPTTNLQERLPLVLFPVQVDDLNIVSPKDGQRTIIQYGQAFHPQEFLSEIFHPPAC